MYSKLDNNLVIATTYTQGSLFASNHMTCLLRFVKLDRVQELFQITKLL